MQANNPGICWPDLLCKVRAVALPQALSKWIVQMRLSIYFSQIMRAWETLGCAPVAENDATIWMV
jgi:hypothetical protein